MKPNLFFLFLILFAGCHKDKGTTELCVLNNTSAVFNNADSWVSYGSIAPRPHAVWDQVSGLDRGVEKCFAIHELVQGRWYARLALDNYLMGSWEGPALVKEGQSTKVEMTDAANTFDVRNSIAGTYLFDCQSLVLSNQDTISLHYGQFLGTITADPSDFLSLQIQADTFYKGRASFEGDINHLTLKDGWGTYPPGFNNMYFTNDTILGGNKTRRNSCTATPQ